MATPKKPEDRLTLQIGYKQASANLSAHGRFVIVCICLSVLIAFAIFRLLH